MSLSAQHDSVQNNGDTPLFSAAVGTNVFISCSLAWAELFIVTAMLFRPGGPRMILYDTEETDIKIVRDYIMGFPKEDAKGVKVKIS